VLEGFSENELTTLFKVIGTLVDAKNHSRRAILTPNDMNLAEKLLEVAPEAPVLRFDAKYRLRDLMR
jgi:hypothetical protein